MSEDLIPIGVAAQRCGLAVSALRYWEERGLIRSVRNGSGHRCYDPGQLRRIALVRILRDTCMFRLDEIAVVLRGDAPGQRWMDVVEQRLAAIRAEQERLARAERCLGPFLTCTRDHPAEECPCLRDEIDRQLDEGAWTSDPLWTEIA
ncbi:transcriptional regulator, MerR family [Saccharopolyspora shandongensis]|uniref:Transcriptional regulator, MerR family n=1 Tax=Saccharopolyspora shandongensis TaxID=418495 RepID=A0A1H3RNB0_9PSEU|nr:MerR family transcriptional regulator [Saccharopolyspora shandongensis]SDZ27234.1 transcriptional regulator, MerR family [Saccharopolyspora shandongensis]